MTASAPEARDLERRCWPLLLAVCRRDAPATLAGVAAPPWNDRAAMEGLCRLAARNGVLGLVLSVLDRAGVALPQALDFRLEQLRLRAAIIEMRRDLASALLTEAGLDLVLLKGSALVGTLYADPVERDITDLDVLVPEAALKTAVRALARAGYTGPSTWKELCAFRRHHFHIPMDSPGSPTVEVHWTLSRPDGHFRLDERALFARAEAIVRPGLPTLRVPSPEHLLLHLVLQNIQEGFSRLSRVVDFERVLSISPCFDWDTFAEGAREGNLASSAALSLHLASHLLDAPVPAGVLEELRPGAVSRAHLGSLHGLRPAPPEILQGQAAKHLFHFWLLSRAGDRVRLVLSLLRRARAVPSLRSQPGGLRRVLILGKMAAMEGWTLLALSWGRSPGPRRPRPDLWARGRGIDSPSPR